ncbi:MAG: ABC transporter permease [Clostridium sp.]|uniref:ABC transporter permease n=1 Tax=Clostridium sp. TaxID=1506 RepID=UPI003D6D2F0B
MKNFWSLIPRNLMKNKKRVFFIAVGIILSISLIISLSIMLDILKTSSYKRMVDDDGGIYDASFFTSQKKNLEKLSKDSVVNKTSIFACLGNYKLPNTKYILEINGYDNNIAEFLNFKLSKGRYPKNNNEIAMEEWILNNMPKKYNIGDKIKLTSSIQYINTQGKPDEIKNEDEFILVGTFEYKFNKNGQKNKAIAYVTKNYVEGVLPSKYIQYGGYLITNSNNPIEKGIQLLEATDDYEKIFFKRNSSKIFTLQIFKTVDFISIVLYIIISIVASVIIYNIFNMSVTERIREFGMLRAIGASPSKIKILVLGEGLILGCIFIPLGIIIGSFVVKGIIILMSGYKDFSAIMDIPKNGVIASFIVGFLTIVIGVYSPAKKASKISPMEAINSNNNLQLKGKNIKKNSQVKNIISKNFGFAEDMAYLNLNRNKKRFITTLVSLSISIIMFMIINYLINCSDPLNSIKTKMGGDFLISTTNSQQNYSISDKDLEDIKNINGIDKVNKSNELKTTIEVEREKITNEGMKYIERESKKSPEAKNNFQQKIYSFNATAFGYTSENLKTMKKHIVKGKIDINDMNEKPEIILAQNLNYNNNTKLNLGDSIVLDYPYYDSKGNFVNMRNETFIIRALLNQDYAAPDMKIGNVVIMSDKVAEKYLNIKGYQNIKINLSKNGNYDEVEKTLKYKLSKHRGATLVSYKEALEKAKKDNLQVSLIMYSFVVVVAIVSIVNLLNIMSMNVLLRKKEIGMLRAIGFGNDEVKKMIRAEGIFYGVASGFWGTAFGTVLSFIFFVLTRKSLTQGMTWRFPIVTIIALFLVTIVICLLSSINASRRVFSSSIVESIKGGE